MVIVVPSSGLNRSFRQNPLTSDNMTKIQADRYFKEPVTLFDALIEAEDDRNTDRL